MIKLTVAALIAVAGLAAEAQAAPQTLDADQLLIKVHPSDHMLLYPEKAREEGIEGKVTLLCKLTAGGHMRCTVQSEDPSGHGFGKAARALFDTATVSWRVASDQTLAGHQVLVPFKFKMD